MPTADVSMRRAFSARTAHERTDEEAAEVWSAAVNSLPLESQKFTLNAASDTLPHNSTLSIWRRREGLTDGCKLCGRKQTLLHILNDCPVALELRRYNQRQDSVLNKNVGFIKPRLPPGSNIIADLPGAMYQYPLSLLQLTDIVIWHENPKEATDSMLGEKLKVPRIVRRGSAKQKIKIREPSPSLSS